MAVSGTLRLTSKNVKEVLFIKNLKKNTKKNLSNIFKGNKKNVFVLKCHHLANFFINI